VKSVCTFFQATFVMPPDGQSNSEWDAGMMGCGELILELRSRLGCLPPGTLFTLIAHDPGVPEDLPAWCRMTGHHLREAAPPRFVIQRKSEAVKKSNQGDSV
jgi:tRNA 2-thiouridine synthesizing protein A